MRSLPGRQLGLAQRIEERVVDAARDETHRSRGRRGNRHEASDGLAPTRENHVLAGFHPSENFGQMRLGFLDVHLLSHLTKSTWCVTGQTRPRPGVGRC